MEQQLRDEIAALDREIAQTKATYKQRLNELRRHRQVLIEELAICHQ